MLKIKVGKINVDAQCYESDVIDIVGSLIRAVNAVYTLVREKIRR